MRLFMCFGGSAAVVDDDDVAAAAVVAARHRRERTRSLSFRGNFLLPGNRKDKAKKQSPVAEAKKTGVDADADDASGLLTHASTAASSSAPLSSAAASLEDSGFKFPSVSSSRHFSTASSSSSTSVSSSPSVSGVLSSPPPPATQQQASEGPTTTTTCPTAGAAAVVLCLLMVVFCGGRVGATVLTSTALYLFPRRWAPARARSMHAVDYYSPECGAEEEEEETTQRKVVTEKGSCFSVRNRKN